MTIPSSADPAATAIHLTRRLPPNANAAVNFSLPLTAEERTRSRHYFEPETGLGVYLRLPRGTVLRHGDLLQSDDQTISVRVIAQPEPVLVVTAETSLDLLRAAYHLGNRHVPLQVTAEYLRLAPDSVLQAMLEQLGVQVTQALLPFEPESGAYGSQGHQHHHHQHHQHHHQHHQQPKPY